MESFPVMQHFEEKEDKELYALYVKFSNREYYAENKDNTSANSYHALIEPNVKWLINCLYEEVPEMFGKKDFNKKLAEATAQTLSAVKRLNRMRG